MAEQCRKQVALTYKCISRTIWSCGGANLINIALHICVLQNSSHSKTVTCRMGAVRSNGLRARLLTQGSLLRFSRSTSHSDETLNRGPRLRITFLYWWDVKPSSLTHSHVEWKSISVMNCVGFQFSVTA